MSRFRTLFFVVIVLLTPEEEANPVKTLRMRYDRGKKKHY